MSKLKTAGQLRDFLADVLVGIKAGTIDAEQANSISKISAQINQSLTTELNARVRLKELGEEASGSMLLGTPAEEEAPEPEPVAEASAEPTALVQSKPAVSLAPVPRRDADKVWCDQCDMRVTVGQAVSCKSAHCKAKDAA